MKIMNILEHVYSDTRGTGPGKAKFTGVVNVLLLTAACVLIPGAGLYGLGEREPPQPQSQPQAQPQPSTPEQNSEEIIEEEQTGLTAGDTRQLKQERLAMVENHIAGGRIDDPLVLKAMRNTPRHLFIPENRRHAAYQNRPQPIGYGQTISQPFVVAYMTELLELRGDERILEIGTGSGYQAAVLAEITPHVYTIEIIEVLAGFGESNLRSAGYHEVQVKAGDGYYGWEEQGPFDGIIVTAAAGHVPPPLINQLKPGGVIVIPVGGVYQVQTLMRITKNQEGDIFSEQLLPVRFVPMTGAVQE